MRRVNILDKIDNFFLSKKPNERSIIYFSIFIVFALLSYQYLFPYSSKVLKKSKTEKRKIESKIFDDKNYIASITINGDREFFIKKIQKEIKNLKEKFANLKHENEYLDFQLQTISTLLFNEQNWAKFLDSIAKKAKDSKVNIDYIGNEFIKNTKNFGHVLEIEIGCNGDFKNIISFINSLEQSELVVDIYNMNLEKKYNIETILKVSVWGVNY